MKLRSLQGRMLALSLLATLIALAIAAWAIAGVLGRFVMQGLDRRLDAELAVLASAVRDDGSVDRERLAARSGILAAEPGWRWRIAGPRGTLSSADFPLLDLGPPGPLRPDGPAPIPAEGRDGEGAVHARQVTIASGSGPVTLIAAAPRTEVARPIRGAIVPLLSALAALAAILTAAALLQLRYGLRPVRRLRDQVAAIRAGSRAGVDEDQPSELQPLAIELNALAADRAKALAGARSAAANLAHALKTPVATLALTTADHPDAQRQARRIEEVIAHHLARARSFAVDTRTDTLVAPIVADVVAAVTRLQPMIAITVEADHTLCAAIDPNDLTEIAGNLIDNAARHAETRVEVTVAAAGREILVIVADDGPGIPAELRVRATEPGVRLDQRGGGDGFGLAIVRELVGLYNGSLMLDAAPAGGLVATVSLPRGRDTPADCR